MLKSTQSSNTVPKEEKNTVSPCCALPCPIHYSDRGEGLYKRWSGSRCYREMQKAVRSDVCDTSAPNPAQTVIVEVCLWKNTLDTGETLDQAPCVYLPRLQHHWTALQR